MNFNPRTYACIISSAGGIHNSVWIHVAEVCTLKGEGYDKVTQQLQINVSYKDKSLYFWV